MSDDDEWVDPDDQMGLWEYQLQALTVHWLRLALNGVEGALPVQVEFYDGSTSRPLRPMHIDLKGSPGQPTAVVITVA